MILFLPPASYFIFAVIFMLLIFPGHVMYDRELHADLGVLKSPPVPITLTTDLYSSSM